MRENMPEHRSRQNDLSDPYQEHGPKERRTITSAWVVGQVTEKPDSGNANDDSARNGPTNDMGPPGH